MKAHRLIFGLVLFVVLAALLMVLIPRVPAKVPHHTDHTSCESCKIDACLPLCHGIPHIDNVYFIHIEVPWPQSASR